MPRQKGCDTTVGLEANITAEMHCLLMVSSQGLCMSLRPDFADETQESQTRLENYPVQMTGQGFPTLSTTLTFLPKPRGWGSWEATDASLTPAYPVMLSEAHGHSSSPFERRGVGENFWFMLVYVVNMEPYAVAPEVQVFVSLGAAMALHISLNIHSGGD